MTDELSADEVLKHYDEREKEIQRFLEEKQHIRGFATVKRAFTREIAQMNRLRPILLKLAKLEAKEKRAATSS